VDTSSYRDLAELLEQLKLRSGRSYESIGQRIYVSKSAVHRYCTGLSVPQEFGVVERIGLTCGATKKEMAQLHGLWLRATIIADDLQKVDKGEWQAKETTSSKSRSVGTGNVAGPELIRPARTRKLSLVAVSFVIGTSITVALSSSANNTSHDGDGAVLGVHTQLISGPSWQLPPASIPGTMFGVTIQSSTGAMPAFRVGAVRFWDSGTRWSLIEPRRGEFDWSVLDRLVSNAEAAQLPSLFVFGSTPRWASPAGPVGPYPDGTPAPPDQLVDWEGFVRAVAARYRGRIESYELWVLGNDRRLYAGSVETLVEMTRRAANVIRSTDPKATVVCPGMGQLWDPEAAVLLKRFAELGGYNYCDVASVKLAQRSASDPPETMLELTALVDRAFHAAGTHPRIWNTGTTYTIPLETALDDATARKYAVRFFLVGLYARNANVERMYFYNWGGTKIPIVLQAVGGVPTSAALAVEQLQRWLTHAQSRSCGHGAAINLPENVWQCALTITGADRQYDAALRWTDSGMATTTGGPHTRAVQRLDGSSTQVQPEEAIRVTDEPVLIEYSMASPH
jgi:helix-turn-helix protein